jgi:tetraacyldisaccharide 4'-kinase
MNKPKFWDEKINYIAIILSPLSFIFSFLVFLKKKITKATSFKIPIVCIGNIYIGGTGKTPVSIFLANELASLGKKPVIIRKFYKNHRDEYNLIRNSFKNLIIGKDRIEGIRKAETSNYNIALLDDGLQDYKIKKDLNIVCFNNYQLIGNGLVLPSGPLRENLSALKNFHIVIINGKKNKQFEEKILKINDKLDIFYSYYMPQNLDQFKNKKLLAIAGIGNPENFFQLIENNKLKIEKKLIYPDHYVFSESEIKNIIKDAEINNYQIIMTEKDYFKINHFNIKKINYLKISLELEKKEMLLNRIRSVYE